MLKLTDSGVCFACGENNPIGLHLQFRMEGVEYITEFTPQAHHQGFEGIVHGGMLATVLDEVMARNLWVRDIPALTAEMRITLHHPAYIGECLLVSGAIASERGRLILCEARARRTDGTVVASAQGKFVRV